MLKTSFPFAITVVVLLTSLGSSPHAMAQNNLVIDGTSETLDDGLTHTFDGVTVGDDLPNSFLTIENGSVLNTEIFRAEVGSSGGSAGTLTVTGPGSSWTNSSAITLGRLGSGTMIVEDGGHVSSGPFDSHIGLMSGADGTAIVTGVGSQWTVDRGLNVGGGSSVSGGTGNLAVESGGEVRVGVDTLIPGTLKLWNDGSLTLNGGSVLAHSFDHTVGSFNHHDGELTVGKLTVSGAIAAGTYSQAPGTLIIDGNTSAALPSMVLNNGTVTSGIDGLRVGNSRQGSLTVRGGSALDNAGDGLIGFGSDSVGMLTVTGTGSQLNNAGILTVGVFGSGALTVGPGGNVSNNNASIGSGSGSEGTVLVSSNQSGLDGVARWTSDGTLTVGGMGDGTLMIESTGIGVARVVSANGIVGDQAGAVGTVTLSSATILHAQWSNSGSLTVGNEGMGKLDIGSRTRVTSETGIIAAESGSTGEISVKGQWTNAGDIYVGGNSTGPGGTGTLNVQGGLVATQGILKLWEEGTVTLDGGSIRAHSFDRTQGTFYHHDGELRVGDIVDGGGNYAQSPGLLVIDGNTATAQPSMVLINGADTAGIDDLFVANSRQGSLTVEGGSMLTTSNEGRIGVNSGSQGEVTVTGADSQWEIGTTLRVGERGTASLTIENGGQVTNTSSNIAVFSDSAGTVTVTGNGSQWNNSDNLYIGGSESGPGGTGTLDVAAGGALNVGGATTVFANGSLIVQDGGNVRAGTLTNEGLIEIATGGTMRGSSSSSNTGTMANHGTFIGDITTHNGGLLTGTGVFDGTVTIGDGGYFSPGNSPGTVSTSMTVWDTGGSYLWEINALLGFGGSEGSDPGWDLWHTGDLSISGPFTVALTTLTLDNDLGLLANWDPIGNYRWLIATADNSAFSSSALNSLSIDDSAFQNSRLGVFSLVASLAGDELYLQYHTSAVPEPSSIAIMIIGGLGLLGGYTSVRNRKNSKYRRTNQSP